MGTGSMIRMLKSELWLWTDLVGADGVELYVAVDCGVLDEDCDAMDMILAQEFVGEVWDWRKGVECQGGRGLPA